MMCTSCWVVEEAYNSKSSRASCGEIKPEMRISGTISRSITIRRRFKSVYGPEMNPSLRRQFLKKNLPVTY